MIRVILESPYKGEIEKNVEYARRCVKDALEKGEAALPSHLLWTQEGILNDAIPEEREQGIEAGFVWAKVAAYAVVYTDLGISEGMEKAIERHKVNGLMVKYRRIDG